MAAQQIKQLIAIEVVRALVPREPLLQLGHDGFQHHLRTDGEDRPLALGKPLRPTHERSVGIQQVGNDEKQHFAVAAREVDCAPPEAAMLAVVGRVDLARIKQREGNIGTLAQAGECRSLLEASPRPDASYKSCRRPRERMRGPECCLCSRRLRSPTRMNVSDVLLAPNHGDQSNSHLSFPALRSPTRLAEHPGSSKQAWRPCTGTGAFSHARACSTNKHPAEHSPRWLRLPTALCERWVDCARLAI